jgi:hypothetical protein
MIVPPLSPFRRRHAEAARMARLAALPVARGAARLPYTRFRKFKYPLAALLVQRELGNVRHALARRVVAGTMSVHFAFEHRPATPTLKES